MTYEEIEQHPKWELQVQLEEEMRSLGIKRFTDTYTDALSGGRATSQAAVRRKMDTAHLVMVEAITAFMEGAKERKAGRRHAAVAMFEEVGDPNLMAHLTLRVVLDQIAARGHLTATAIHLATLIEDEIQFSAFKEAKPGYYKWQMAKLKKKTNDGYRRASTRSVANKLGVERPNWDTRSKVLLGTKLIEMVVETTGLVRITNKYEGKNNTPTVIEATEATIEWLKTENSRLEWLSPMYLPTVVPPRPWTSPFSGGYWTARCRKLTLVKTPSRPYLEELAARDLSVVYTAINALQDTEWRINRRILEVMKTLWDSGTTLGIIPEVNERPLPQKPAWLTPEMKKDDMTEDQFRAFLDWKTDCARVYDENASLVTKRAAFSRMLWVADKFVDETMYFPHTLDFRGRVYPVPLFLHPQGDDTQRGLLSFGQKVPVGDEDGALWLAVHGAGCWGVDKVSLEERRHWIEDHEQEILAASNDPLAHTFWLTAEKPWQALAFCFEWAGFKREGYAYLSDLPVQMDGTCNGLQNFSAILRDSVGGAAVNLIPSDKPQDIYQRVADIVSRRVEDDALSSDPDISTLAKGWIGRVTRKVCKRPVMTLAYGAREFGFKQQVFDDTVKPWKQSDPENFPWTDSGWEAASYMGKLIWNSVGEVVVAARVAMDWLQVAARVSAKDGMAVHWSTPAGFLVRQAYKLPNTKVLDLAFQKVRLQLKYNVGSEKLDPRRQASGISPNWIHSLDASHMKLTIAKCVKEHKINSFCMIHDSYGTHAGRAQTLATVLRQEFVRMYTEHDVLKEFRDALAEQLGDANALPPLPEHGDLDLSQVLESRFFFA